MAGDSTCRLSASVDARSARDACPRAGTVDLGTVIARPETPLSPRQEDMREDTSGCCFGSTVLGRCLCGRRHEGPEVRPHGGGGGVEATHEWRCVDRWCYVRELPAVADVPRVD
jgi:hypothetical protein